MSNTRIEKTEKNEKNEQTSNTIWKNALTFVGFGLVGAGAKMIFDAANQITPSPTTPQPKK